VPSWPEESDHDRRRLFFAEPSRSVNARAHICRRLTSPKSQQRSKKDLTPALPQSAQRRTKFNARPGFVLPGCSLRAAGAVTLCSRSASLPSVISRAFL